MYSLKSRTCLGLRRTMAITGSDYNVNLLTNLLRN